MVNFRGLFTSKRKLRGLLDTGRIERAIVEAERRTSGEIRVSVAPWFWGSVEKAARKTFIRLGMDQTRDRNGILFFVVPGRHAFFVYGDTGIHERVGQTFWDDVAAALSSSFQRGEFTEGLVLGIETAAKKLEQYFPYDAEADKDELTNQVDVQ